MLLPSAESQLDNGFPFDPAVLPRDVARRDLLRADKIRNLRLKRLHVLTNAGERFFECGRGCMDDSGTQNHQRHFPDISHRPPILPGAAACENGTKPAVPP